PKRESSARMSPASNSSSSGSTSRLRTPRSRLHPSPRQATIMSETTRTRPLLALLHLCDSLFPIGAFGYSDGLEAATAAGLGHTPAALQAWVGLLLGGV